MSQGLWWITSVNKALKVSLGIACFIFHFFMNNRWTISFLFSSKKKHVFVFRLDASLYRITRNKSTDRKRFIYINIELDHIDIQCGKRRNDLYYSI